MLNKIVEFGVDLVVYWKNKILFFFVNGYFYIVIELIVVYFSIIVLKFDLVNFV